MEHAMLIRAEWSSEKHGTEKGVRWGLGFVGGRCSEKDL